VYESEHTAGTLSWQREMIFAKFCTQPLSSLVRNNDMVNNSVGVVSTEMFALNWLKSKTWKHWVYI